MNGIILELLHKMNIKELKELRSEIDRLIYILRWPNEIYKIY